jgi:6-phosphogluconolactonase
MLKHGLLYVGTHRRAHRADPADLAFGIYAFRAQYGSSGLEVIGMCDTPQPGWIAAHPNGRFLYATNEVADFAGTSGGGVSAFAINAVTGSLNALNTQRTPALPCHCAVDATGRFLLVATFGGGSVHLFPLAPDGRIGSEADAHQHIGSSVHPRRQTQPHAHQISIDPANRFVLAPDLGIDQIIVYELELEKARLIAKPECNVRLAPGSGPRHIAFDPLARFAYLMNEMSATVTVFSYDSSRGALREIQMSDLLPEGFKGLRSGAEIGVHPKGRFLYASTRSHGSSGEPPVRGLDSLSWFEIDGNNGTLHQRGRVASGGEIPRSFCFDSSGDHLFVGHQCSGTIVAFRIDPQSGAPVATGEITTTPVPVCLRFLATD